MTIFEKLNRLSIPFDISGSMMGFRVRLIDQVGGRGTIVREVIAEATMSDWGTVQQWLYGQALEHYPAAQGELAKWHREFGV